jgi:hypothetical protein
LIVAISSWFFTERNKPDYVGILLNNGLVKLYEIDEEYQCPKYCGANHIHKTHYNSKKCDKCNHIVVKKEEIYKKYNISIKK